MIYTSTIKRFFHIIMQAVNRSRGRVVTAGLLIIPALLIIAVFHFSGWEIFSVKVPAAKQGVLDLRAWDFSSGGSIGLSGEWEFYWDRLLGPEDFRRGMHPRLSGFFKVPGSWKGYILDDVRLRGTGYATYRLRVVTGRHLDNMAFSFKTVSTALRFYVHGKHLTSIGNVGDNERDSIPAYRSHAVYAGPLPGEFDIIMQISNFHYRTGGPWREIQFGMAAKINRHNQLRIALTYIFFGGILIMFFYHLTMFFIRQNDIHFLYFSVFCLLIAFRTISTEDYLIGQLIPSLPFDGIIRIEYLSYILAIPVFGYFLRSLFRESASFLIVNGIGAVCLLFAIPVCCTPTVIFTHIIGYFNVFGIACSVYYVYILIFASKRKQMDSRIFLIGFIVLFLSYVNDYLHNSFILRTINIIDAGLFVFIFTQAYTLSRRFTLAYHDIEDLSSELRNLNINQERIIEERTRDLVTKQRMIDRQLQLARSIQQSLIPDVSCSIHDIQMKAVYLPLDEVGGDFYDVIRIDDNTIGIFLADVSGHGVPAAMIASMVKSFINLHGQSGLTSSEFLQGLNKLLFPMIQGYFVTCFYGILSIDTYEMEYSLAGHPAPVLVKSTGEIYNLNAKGTALGIRDILPLEARIVSFSAQDRMYLFSDGVTDVFSPEGEIFGITRLTGLFQQQVNDDIDTALNRIMLTLRDFQERPEFTDDVTLLVVNF
ncbi:MAG TPA: SpoIIE family protein phosphatase [Spirochaetota bacterium]|nr:SpoIIE family protein phosphatase [Spirochaetota bacterium]